MTSKSIIRNKINHLVQKIKKELTPNCHKKDHLRQQHASIPSTINIYQVDKLSEHIMSLHELDNIHTISSLGILELIVITMPNINIFIIFLV